MQPNDDQNNLQPNTPTPSPQAQDAPAPQPTQQPVASESAPLVSTNPALVEPQVPVADQPPAPMTPAEPQPQANDLNSRPDSTEVPPEFNQYNIDPEVEEAFADADTDIDVSGQTVEWRASEYIHHEKGVLWFLALGAITIAAAALTAFLGQWMFAVLIAVMGFALGFFAMRPPREINYSISPKGVAVGEKLFPFTQFKSFGVLEEGAFYSVQLRPAKRFAPGVSIYFSHDDGEKIFDALSAHLPAEEISHDPFDRLMRRLRF